MGRKEKKKGEAMQRFDTYHGYEVEGRNVEGQMYRGGHSNSTLLDYAAFL